MTLLAHARLRWRNCNAAHRQRIELPLSHPHTPIFANDCHAAGRWQPTHEQDTTHEYECSDPHKVIVTVDATVVVCKRNR